MTDQELITFNGLGFIPGPKETKENFLLRISYCLDLKTHYLKLIGSAGTPMTLEEVSKDALKSLKLKFDIHPHWIPVFFSNHQLMPWHGGSAWIFQAEDHLPTGAFFQLRNALKKDKFLKIYKQEELISHEACHVSRMMFEEPQFEEMIAYRTSNSSFRRYFGPIIQSSKESMLFICSLFIIFLLDLFMIFYDTDLFKSHLFKIIPLSLLIFGLIRLWQRHRTFSKTLNRLKEATGKPDIAEAIIYRLTDHEIKLFSTLSPAEIIQYIKEHKNSELRLYLIDLAYLYT